MTSNQLRRLVDADIDRLGSRSALARELGMSIQQLSSTLNDGRPIPERIANHYGYTQIRKIVVRYERINAGSA